MSGRSPPLLTRSDLPGTTWPPLALGQNAVLAALVAQLRVTERLSRDVIEAMQGRQLARLAAHHAAHTPAFAVRLAAAGLTPADLDSLANLRALAPIRRRDVQDAGESFFSRRVPEAALPLTETKTSGSTGEPVTVRKTATQALMWSAITLRDLDWHGLDFSSRMTVIRPHITAFYESSGWGRPVDDLYAAGSTQGIPITTDIDKQLRLIRRFKPGVLVLYPSNLQAFAGRWLAGGVGYAGLRHIRTLGETVGPALREEVARATGLAIEDHYSSQEAGSIAVQCPVSGLYHIMAESLIVEVLDAGDRPCGEGELGRVVVTDLHNLATPLIRYEIGDVAQVGGPCPCGRTLPTLARILGRERNLVLMPDGRRHWPLVGFASFETVAPVRQYQLIQHSLTDVEMRVVTDLPLADDQARGLAGIVREAMGHPFDVEVVWFEGRLPVGANGKFEEFLCKVPTSTDRY